MEHEHEASSSSSAYNCSIPEELGVASSSAAEDAGPESTSRRTWTTVDFSTDGEDEGFYVSVVPGNTVRKFNMEEIQLLDKIGEGGQGTIYTGEYTLYDNFLAAKVYKGRQFGLWPEVVFGLHSFSQYICKFHDYCLEKKSSTQEESFYLLMTKYDCSLHDILDKRMQNFRGKPFPDFITLQMMFQIAMGMWFLHENNIIHRDVRANNVFLTTSSSGVQPHSFM